MQSNVLSFGENRNTSMFDQSNKGGLDEANARYWNNLRKHERSQRDLFRKIREERRSSKRTNKVKQNDISTNSMNAVDENSEQNHVQRSSKVLGRQKSGDG